MLKNTLSALTLVASVSIAQAQTTPIAAPPAAMPAGAPAGATGATEGTATALQRVAKGLPIRIGVRASSSPLSYKLGDSYTGLAVDLCLKTVEHIKKARPEATAQLVEVTSANRIDKLLNNEIDMECGSTTNTAKRRAQVDFSIPYYFANIKAVKLASNKAITSVSDLEDGTRIIYTKGTSTEQAIGNVSIKFKFKSEAKRFNAILGKDHQDSFDKLTRGEGDIFANDDILLVSLIQKSGNPSYYQLLPEVFSIEPYAVMTRKTDKDLSDIINAVIRDEMASGGFNALYAKWFTKPIPPSNIALNIPMGSLLRDVLRNPTPITGN